MTFESHSYPAGTLGDIQAVTVTVRRTRRLRLLAGLEKFSESPGESLAKSQPERPPPSDHSQIAAAKLARRVVTR